MRRVERSLDCFVGEDAVDIALAGGACIVEVGEGAGGEVGGVVAVGEGCCGEEGEEGCNSR